MLSIKVDIHEPVLKGQNSKLLVGKKMINLTTFLIQLRLNLPSRIDDVHL